MYKKIVITIVIFLFSTVSLLAQTHGTIRGTTVDSEDVPLEGVNIIIKGTTVGTVTDINGNFSIDVSSKDDVLVFSSVGLLSEEVLVGEKQYIELLMVADLTKLDEVVVVGYGTQTKVTVTGSVSTTSGEDIKKSPSANLSSSLAGRLPGPSIGIHRDARHLLHDRR